MRVLRRWKQVTKPQKRAYLEACHYSLCASGLLAFFIMRGSYESPTTFPKETDSCFLVPTI